MDFLKSIFGFELSEKDVEEIKNCQSSKIAHDKAVAAETLAERETKDADEKLTGVMDYFGSAYHYKLASAWYKREEELKKAES